jgi:hypothetical protein
MQTRAVALVQGAYYIGTGVWPLIDIESFEKVTGPKVDKWLVRTVGALVAVIGGTIVSAAVRRTVTAETAALAVGSAAVLGAIDVIYASKGRIAPIYFADAGAEALLATAWAVGARRTYTEASPLS